MQPAPIVNTGVLVRERILPTAEGLATLFPEGGLVRGRAVACRGQAATSVALALVAPAVAAGSWAVLVDLPTLGLDAASERGIPLERLVAVSRPAGLADDRWRAVWAEVLAAAVDGIDVVLTRVPAGVPAGLARRVLARLQRSEAVVVVLGDPGTLSCAATLDTRSSWSGLGTGWGHLARHDVEIEATGRRLPVGRECHLQFAA